MTTYTLYLDEWRYSDGVPEENNILIVRKESCTVIKPLSALEQFARNILPDPLLTAGSTTPADFADFLRMCFKELSLSSKVYFGLDRLQGPIYDPAFVRERIFKFRYHQYANTRLAKRIIKIEKGKKTPQEKIDRIKGVLEAKGHCLKVVGNRLWRTE